MDLDNGDGRIGADILKGVVELEPGEWPFDPSPEGEADRLDEADAPADGGLMVKDIGVVISFDVDGEARLRDVVQVSWWRRYPQRENADTSY